MNHEGIALCPRLDCELKAVKTPAVFEGKLRANERTENKEKEERGKERRRKMKGRKWGNGKKKGAFPAASHLLITP